MDVNKYKTLGSPATGEFKDRGSKFLAFAYPLINVEEVKKKVQDLKKEHTKAKHYCYVYRIGTDRVRHRANDDGEPPGSAGKPILGQIDSHGLTNVLVVVVRYFGGNLLGIPGLVNAYRSATEIAFSQARTAEKWIEDLVNVNFDYSVTGEVLYLLKQAGATICRQELQLFCSIAAGIPVIYTTECLQKIEKIRSVTVIKEKRT